MRSGCRAAGEVHGCHEGEPGGAQPAWDCDGLPVFLGGAALTRAYVEQDLREIFAGEVRYARDAFEGLRLMDALMAVKRGERGLRCQRPGSDGSRPAGRPSSRAGCHRGGPALASRSTSTYRLRRFGATGSSKASPWPMSRPTSMLRAGHFHGPVGFKGTRNGVWSQELVESEGRPRLGAWLDRIQTDAIAEFAVVYEPGPATARATTLSCSEVVGSRCLRSSRRAAALQLPPPDPWAFPLPSRLLPRSSVGG